MRCYGDSRLWSRTIAAVVQPARQVGRPNGVSRAETINSVTAVPPMPYAVMRPPFDKAGTTMSVATRWPSHGVCVTRSAT